jgi:hypothetical protein
MKFILPLQLLLLPATAYLLGEPTRYTGRKGTLCTGPVSQMLHAYGSDQAESLLSHHAVAAAERESSCSWRCIFSNIHNSATYGEERAAVRNMCEARQPGLCNRVRI